ILQSVGEGQHPSPARAHEVNLPQIQTISYTLQLFHVPLDRQHRFVSGVLRLAASHLVVQDDPVPGFREVREGEEIGVLASWSAVKTDQSSSPPSLPERPIVDLQTKDSKIAVLLCSRHSL